MSNLNSKTQLSPKWRKTIVVWVLINVFALSLNEGLFGSWITIESPPSSIKRIITADVGDLWVETHDGNYFVAKIRYGEMAELSHWWESATYIPEISEQQTSALRGNDCKKLRFSPFLRNPAEKIIECIYAESSDSLLPLLTLKNESYFAYMANGNVYLWKNHGGVFSMLNVFMLLGIFLLNSLFVLAAFISGISLAIQIIRVRYPRFGFEQQLQNEGSKETKVKAERHFSNYERLQKISQLDQEISSLNEEINMLKQNLPVMPNPIVSVLLIIGGIYFTLGYPENIFLHLLLGGAAIIIGIGLLINRNKFYKNIFKPIFDEVEKRKSHLLQLVHERENLEDADDKYEKAG